MKQPEPWTAGTRASAAGTPYLHNLAFQVLLEDPTPERVAATSRLARATTAMIAGQAADMAFDDLPRPSSAFRGRP